MSIEQNIAELRASLPGHVTLVAVSKTHPAEAVARAYAAGQRVFGENRPQEMRQKHDLLPADIEWHLIGHLQTNKIKYIIDFVSMIHSADSASLLLALEKHAARAGRTVDVLLEIHISAEESKQGWHAEELDSWLRTGQWRQLEHIRFRGLMGVASNTGDESVLRAEFGSLASLRLRLESEYFGSGFDTLSMGMSSDYRLAVDCGSNMVRLGSLIFGQRDYTAR